MRSCFWDCRASVVSARRLSTVSNSAVFSWRFFLNSFSFSESLGKRANRGQPRTKTQERWSMKATKTEPSVVLFNAEKNEHTYV